MLLLCPSPSLEEEEEKSPPPMPPFPCIPSLYIRPRIRSFIYTGRSYKYVSFGPCHSACDVTFLPFSFECESAFHSRVCPQPVLSSSLGSSKIVSSHLAKLFPPMRSNTP